MQTDKRPRPTRTEKALLSEAKDWTAVTLCLVSAGYTYWTATTRGIDVCSPLLLACAVWVYVGAWRGNFFRPYSPALLKLEALREHLLTVSPLSKSIFKGSASLVAAYVIFRTSQAFV